MRITGRARFGVSLVYKVGGILGEMRFTNLTEREARETIQERGRPSDVTVSKENKESQATDTLQEAQELANRLRRELGYNPLSFSRSQRTTRTLWVNGKAFRVRDGPGKWRLMRNQMTRILEITKPEDWLFALDGHFDGQIDGWAYGDGKYKPATPGLIHRIREDLQRYEGTYVDFNTEPKDTFGNPQEVGVFEIWNLAIFSYRLKPRDGLVRFEDGKNEIPDIIDLSELEAPKTQNLPEPPRDDEKAEILDGIQPIAKTFNLSEDEAAKVLAALSSAIQNTENPAQAIERFTSLAPRELRKAFMLGFLLSVAAIVNTAEKNGRPDYIG
ncbi:MAG: hypothetical protein JRD89_04430 [Deltaproteobacteria bacterium]|nr:hypothetical protein [Deltaproteobacteria bacterium]